MMLGLGCSYQAPVSPGDDDDPIPDSSPEPDSGTADAPTPDAPPDTPQPPACAGYTPAGTSAYLVGSENADWPTAKSACEGLANGHLVVIADATENTLVRGLLPMTARFWMGFSDLEVENTWKWLDGTDVPRAAEFWDGAQPNDNQTFGGEDCGEMSNTGTWNDKACSNAQPFVCECP